LQGKITVLADNRRFSAFFSESFQITAVLMFFFGKAFNLFFRILIANMAGDVVG